VRVKFDQTTVVLLLTRADAPAQDDATRAAVQDAHLAHLAELHDAGHLLAAGPLPGPPDRLYRGLVLLNVEPDRALERMADDPAVRAGWFGVKAMPWLVPTGAMSFTPTRFPRTIADVEAD
jgi:uncharacterized protein YciI